MNYILWLFILFFLMFIYVFFKERRTLFLGFTFLLSVIFLGIYLFLLLSSSPYLYENNIIRIIILIIGFLVLFSILFSPIIFTIVCLYNGIKIIRREGLTPRNILSVVLGLMMLSYLYIGPLWFVSYENRNIYVYIYIYILYIIAYFFVLSILYTLSSYLNYFNFFSKKLEYIVVLGAGLNGDKVTPLLASRINKGIKLYRKNRFSKIIMSGGQGSDEMISEAQAMANYAVEMGVRKEDIILEDQSTNTEENILFSANLIPKDSKIAIVTNHYHLFRALLFAKKLGVSCIGYGARTKFYFSLNAFIREFIGYIYLSRKKHFYALIAYTILYLVGVAISFSDIWKVIFTK